jgi:hypothetical protein
METSGSAAPYSIHKKISRLFGGHNIVPNIPLKIGEEYYPTPSEWEVWNAL